MQPADHRPLSDLKNAKPVIDPATTAILQVNPTGAPTNGEKPLTVDGVPGTYNVEPVAGAPPSCNKVTVTPQGKPTRVISPMVCG